MSEAISERQAVRERVAAAADFAGDDLNDAVDDAVSCADALVASIAEERAVVARRLERVALWADFHCPEPLVEPAGGWTGEQRRQALRVRGECSIAAEGTPSVTRAAVVELGMLLQTSTGSALALLRDVLELRHRLPVCWAAVQNLEVEGWKARQVAVLTRRLTLGQARIVDAQVVGAVTGLPWGRARDVVEGKVIAADPVAHATRLAQDENRVFVSTGRRSTGPGLRTLIARGHAGDIARLEALIAHLAELLAANGDTSAADFRRAKALAMLANPALTCVFLTQAHDTTHQTSEPEPEPEESGSPSAVELAVAFGRVLHGLGAKALDRLRPRSVLYLHLSAEAVQNIPGCGVARVEDPLAGGPISTAQLRAWLANHRITVTGVIDPTRAESVDGYEAPTHLREASRLLHPYETTPWGTTATQEADQDHTIPYVPIDQGGPPGQTGLDNLGPLGRRHHLSKTFAGFAVHQPTLGLYLWRTPTGHWYQVDHRGTHPLGKTPPAVLDLPSSRLRTAELTDPERQLRELILKQSVA